MSKVKKEKMDKPQRCNCPDPSPRESIAIPGAVICDNCMEVISYRGEAGEIKTSATKKEKKAEVKKENVKRVDFSGVGIEINKIYNEDCLKTMERIKDNQVDYTFTSPPYNVGTGGFAKYEGGEQHKDELSQQGYLDWNISIIDTLLRITKNHVFWNVQALTDNRIALATLQEHYKYKIKDIFIWVKRSVAPASTRGVVNSKWEYIFVFSNQEPNLRRFKDGNFHGTLNNVVDVSREINQYADVHKATFPIDLPRLFMQSFGSDGDIWYDPFMGTGTTARAAIVEKKNFIGSEMSKKYWKLANEETMKFYNANGNTISFNEGKKDSKKIEQVKLDLFS